MVTQDPRKNTWHTREPWEYNQQKMVERRPFSTKNKNKNKNKKKKEQRPETAAGANRFHWVEHNNAPGGAPPKRCHPTRTGKATAMAIAQKSRGRNT